MYRSLGESWKAKDACLGLNIRSASTAQEIVHVCKVKQFQIRLLTTSLASTPVISCLDYSRNLRFGFLFPLSSSHRSQGESFKSWVSSHHCSKPCTGAHFMQMLSPSPYNGLQGSVLRAYISPCSLTLQPLPPSPWLPVPALLLPKYIKHYSCLCTDLFLWNILPPDIYLTCSFTSFRSSQMSLPQRCLL